MRSCCFTELRINKNSQNTECLSSNYLHAWQGTKFILNRDMHELQEKDLVLNELGRWLERERERERERLKLTFTYHLICLLFIKRFRPQCRSILTNLFTSFNRKLF